MDPSYKSQVINAKRKAEEDKVTRRIKAIRKEKSISQADMAKFFEIERSNYHRLENRGENLTVIQLQRIAACLGVSVINLLTDELIEVPLAIQEVTQLRTRIDELEDRLRDKQKIIEAAQQHKDYAVRKIYDIILTVAIASNLFPYKDLYVKKEGEQWIDIINNWGAEIINTDGKKVISYGNNNSIVTAKDLLTIYKRLDEGRHDQFDLLTSLVHLSGLSNETLVQRTLIAYSLSKFDEDELKRRLTGPNKSFFDDILKEVYGKTDHSSGGESTAQ